MMSSPVKKQQPLHQVWGVVLNLEVDTASFRPVEVKDDEGGVKKRLVTGQAVGGGIIFTDWRLEVSRHAQILEELRKANKANKEESDLAAAITTSEAALTELYQGAEVSLKVNPGKRPDQIHLAIRESSLDGKIFRRAGAFPLEIPFPSAHQLRVTPLERIRDWSGGFATVVAASDQAAVFAVSDQRNPAYVNHLLTCGGGQEPLQLLWVRGEVAEDAERVEVHSYTLPFDQEAAEIIEIPEATAEVEVADLPVAEAEPVKGPKRRNRKRERVVLGE